jgi:hypothetical protein
MPQIASVLGATAVQLLTPTRTTAETTTVAGVDMKDFVDDILVILSYKRPNASAGATLDVTFKDSADNSTFTALTTPTFAQVLAASTQGSATVAINARAIKRYLQVSYITTGTTGTFDASVVAVGVKQVI